MHKSLRKNYLYNDHDDFAAFVVKTDLNYGKQHSLVHDMLLHVQLLVFSVTPFKIKIKTVQ